MKQFLVFSIVILASLSAYFITDYSTNLQLNTYSLDDIPNSYKVLFNVSKITSALVPIIITCFMVITLNVMLNVIFEQHISTKLIFQIVGFSLFPMLLYYYFFWYNLIIFCNTSNINSIEDFKNMSFLFGLHLTDLSLINFICWIYMYGYIIIKLIFHKITILSALISTLLPSAILLLVYYLISVL